VNYVLQPIKLQNSEDGQKLFFRSKYGILQYIPLKFVCVILMIIDSVALLWEPGNLTVYYFCNFLISVSVSIALYWLLFFFHLMHEEIKKYNPLFKFLVIKGVIFLEFWQEIILSYFNKSLSNSRFIPAKDKNDADVVLSALLINVEMVIMSILTAFAYSYKDFVDTNLQGHVGTIVDVFESNYKETLRDMNEMIEIKN